MGNMWPYSIQKLLKRKPDKKDLRKLAEVFFINKFQNGR